MKAKMERDGERQGDEALDVDEGRRSKMKQTDMQSEGEVHV